VDAGVLNLLQRVGRRFVGRDRLHLFGVAAFVGQLAVLLGIQQHALGRDADPDQAVQLVFEAVGAGGGADAGQAVQALLPAQRDVGVVVGVGVDGDLVAQFAVELGDGGIGNGRFVGFFIRAFGSAWRLFCRLGGGFLDDFLGGVGVGGVRRRPASARPARGCRP
jgi:hypothetical protein